MDLLTGIYITIAAFVLLVIIANYIVYRNIVKAKSISFKFSFGPILLVATAPLLMLSFPFFVTYRQIVSLILYLKYGSKFCGLLEGRDAVYNLENENPVYVLFIVKYPTNRSQNFFNAVKNNVYKVLEQKSKKNYKLFGAIGTYMGYSYILKDEITFDDCFQKLKSTNLPITKDNFMQLLSEYSNIPLPKNRQALWDVLVGTQPVQWSADTENNDVMHYPILLRVNHSFADGQHLIKGILELFDDKYNVKLKSAEHISQNEEPELTQRKLFSRKSILNFFTKTGLAIMFFVKQLVIAFVLPSVAIANSSLMVNDSHALHGPKPTYKKQLFLNVEQSPRYIQVVKRIKKKISNCAFEDVCLTAIAASFAEYFQKNSSHTPEHIVVEVPAVPMTLIQHEKSKVGEMFCRNRLTFAIRKLPMNVDLKNPKALINILQLISKEGALVRLSLEHQVNYFILTVVCHIIPAPILRSLFDIVHSCTALVSNLPGPNLMTVMGGCPVQNAGAWVANRGCTGIGLSFLTYNEQLQLSMVVDEALTPDRTDVQSLIDGVYKYLDLLELETIKHISDKNF